MAVEKNRVIVRLKALFPKANLSQVRLDALADKLALKPADDADNAAIDTVINDFNDVMDIAEIAREDDRIRTLEAKSKEPVPTPPADPKPEPTPAEPVPEWAKALINQNEKLNQDLTELKTGKVLENKRSVATQLFGKSEVLQHMPASAKARWIERIDLDSETSFEDQIKGLETEYTELVQGSADANHYAGPAGEGKANANQVDEKLVNSVIDNMQI